MMMMMTMIITIIIINNNNNIRKGWVLRPGYRAGVWNPPRRTGAGGARSLAEGADQMPSPAARREAGGGGAREQMHPLLFGVLGLRALGCSGF